MQNNPLISIVTVVYNGKDFLEKTIKSVINQTYENIEYIIIDGGSTDGTVDIIKKYEDKITYWVSERDKGIYDAMNKGLMVATGDFLIFMNASDKFASFDVVEKMVEVMTDNQKIYFGRAEVFNGSISWFYPQKYVSSSEIKSWLKKEQPNHQTIFYPKAFYKNEHFDLQYKIFADAEHKHRAYQKSEFIFVDIVVAKFSMDGISSNFRSYSDVRQMLKEAWKIDMKYKGLGKALHTIVKFHVKYLLVLLLDDKSFFTIIRKIKNR